MEENQLPPLPAIPGDANVDRAEIWALMRSYAALAVQQEKKRLFHLVMDACAAQMNMGERNGEEWDRGVWACSVAIDAIRKGEKNG